LIRVLHFITGLNIGGAERMLYNLAVHADRRRFDFQVIALQSGGEIADELRAIGVAVTELGISNPFSAMGALPRLRRIVRDAQPNMLQGWMPHGNLAAWLASLICGRHIPVVWTIVQSLHDLSREKFLTRIIIRYCAWISRNTASILYNSDTARIHHEQLGYNAAGGITIPTGFDTDTYLPNLNSRAEFRRSLGLHENALLVGLVARFDPLKDHANFLSAAAIVTRRHQTARFVLVGRNVDGANQDLVKQVRELGLEENIHLLGVCQNIPKITAALDVAVSSSLSEAFANTIGEAMSCGIPCVVTDVGDSASVVGNCGRVVRPAASEQLATAIGDLLDLTPAERFRLGSLARQRIIDNFSIEKVVARYALLYEGIGARGR